MNPSIASTFARCLEDYEQFMHTLMQSISPLRTQLSLTTVQDEFGRLKVWAGNIAAHKTGRSSLDFRLRDATPMRERIIGLLSDMSDLLQEATCIASGARIPLDNVNFESDSDTDSSDGGLIGIDGNLTASSLTTELQEIFKDIVVVIDCLYKLSMSIRNGVSAHDRLVKAATINTSFFESWDTDHVKAKFPAVKEFLASRLGKSISKRRQYFKYCERHHKKLAQDIAMQQMSAPVPSSPQVAAAEVLEASNNDHEAMADDIGPTFDHSKFEIERSVAATTVLTQTTASEFVGGNNDFEVESDSGQTSTSYATTASFGGRLVIPPLPKESTDGRPFECPYCYTIVSIRSSHAWKKHIFRDLQPYVCTVDACGKAGKLFDTRRDWWYHELHHHRKEWFCTADCQQTFKSQSAFEEHVRATHAITSDHQLGALVDMCHRPVEENAEEQCPLCTETLPSMNQLCRHLARHLEELAFFALPRHKDEEDNDDFGSDKPQPSIVSRELSNGSLSFASNSLHSDPPSEVGDDGPGIVESFIRSNVTSDAGDVEIIDKHLDESDIKRDIEASEIGGGSVHGSIIDGKDQLQSSDSDQAWTVFWSLTNADLMKYTTKEIAQQKTIHAFWQSETLYVNCLTACIEDYQDELTRDWLQVTVFHWIQEALQLISGLKELHEILLHALENRIKTQGPQVHELSDLIEQWLPKADLLYGHYAQRFPTVEWKIKSYAASNSTFKRLFYTRANEFKWAKYMRCPYTRIGSYTVLCDQILANTETAIDESHNLMKVSLEVHALEKTFRNMQARGTSALRILQLDEAFVFKTEYPEVNKKNLQLMKPYRQLFFEGKVEKISTKNNGISFVSHAFLFDKYMVLAKQTGSGDAEKYDIPKEPIPIDLLMLEDSNIDITLEASAVTKVAEVDKDGGRDQRRVLNRSYHPSVLYPFKIRHLGSGEVYTFLVKTSEQRQEWWDKIKLAQVCHHAALQEYNRQPYALNVLSNGDFRNESSKPFNKDFNIGGSPLSKAIDRAGPVVQGKGQISTGVECATISFRGQVRKMVAIGAKTGLFVFQIGMIKVGPTPNLPVVTEDIGLVTEIVTDLECNVTFVLGSSTIYAYDTVTITGTRLASQPEPGRKLLENVRFFRLGTVGASKFLYCVLKPDRVGTSVIVLEVYKGESSTPKKKPPLFSSSSLSSRRSNISFDSSIDATPLTFVPRGYYYRKHEEFRLAKQFSDLVIFSETIVILTDRAFETMALKKKLPKVIPDSRGLQKALKLPRTAGNRQPLGLFCLPEGISYDGVSECFICVYEDCAIHIDQNADITRNTCITFTSNATSATLDSHYLFLFHTDYLEIRNVINGELCQIIAGQDIRCMEAATNRNVLIAMQHPDVEGRELILECVLDDEGTRMREGKGELKAGDGGLTAREESNSRWEKANAKGTASRIGGTLKGGVRGSDNGGSNEDRGDSSGGPGGNCGVM